MGQGPLPVEWAAVQTGARGLRGEALRVAMLHYNHMIGVKMMGEMLPDEANRVTLADDFDQYGLRVARMTASQILILLVRYGLVVLFFPASALDKILNFKGAVKQAMQVFSFHAVAVALILVGGLVELVMPLGILSGIADRLAAFIMAGYCAVTGALFKRLWEPGDFWSLGESKGRELFWDFLKNFSPAFGFLLIVVGLDGRAWQAFVADPLALSHPYATAALPR